MCNRAKFTYGFAIGWVECSNKNNPQNLKTSFTLSFLERLNTMVLHVFFRMAGLIVGEHFSKTHIPEIIKHNITAKKHIQGETVLSENGSLHVTGPTDMILPETTKHRKIES